MQFTLTVDIGNDDVQTYEDVWQIVGRTCYKMHAAGFIDKPKQGESGTGRDLNGNTVARWTVSA